MKQLPSEIEEYRDQRWRREDASRVETAAQVEQMVRDLGFCLALTDARTNLPSVYIAVCGRRDAFMPRNVQKDPEASQAWVLKDEVMRRGQVYYGKLCKGRATFVAPRLLPVFNALWGLPKNREKESLSVEAQKVLQVLRVEWEMGTADLRAAAKIENRAALTKALDELQKCLKVVPQEVLYQPKFTYIWTLSEARFPKELAQKIAPPDALDQLALAYLEMCGLTLLGDFARAFGFTRKEAGAANHRLVKAGAARRLATGIYQATSLEIALS